MLLEQVVFVQKLTADPPVSSANFGEAVSISSGLIAVCSPGVSDYLSFIVFIQASH